ncbi:MAG: AraC family transcriptional regulator N-terminal domain-containing protein [Glycocaulis sp.]
MKQVCMTQRTELARQMLRFTPEPGVHATPIERLTLIRSDQPTDDLPSIYEASVCLIAQGTKTVSLGGTSLIYDASSYLVVSVDLPLVGRILQASAQDPYLCCKIDINPVVLTELVMHERHPAATGSAPAFAVHPADEQLSDAACRLVSLLGQPEHAGVLAPLIEKEILYRLLQGPHGPALRRIAQGDSHVGRVGRAAAFIRENYRKPIRVDDVAAAAGMSPSSLHEHFKAITTLTPLEFQKRLRLEAARALMLSTDANAADAAFAVGYQSPSQFSREYRRAFNASPRLDADRLKASGYAAT